MLLDFIQIFSDHVLQEQNLLEEQHQLVLDKNEVLEHIEIKKELDNWHDQLPIIDY